MNILKYLPEDILHKTPDFLAIKSSDSDILEYGPCRMCETPILTDNPSRSFIVNVCEHIHHWTYSKKIDRKGVLSCDTCLISDNRDLLIPF